MTQLLQFKPLYQQRVWGGHVLESWLGRRHLLAGPIGESWEIVDRPEAQSIVASGPAAGASLRDLIVRDPVLIMGDGWPASERFPILVKWLDCRERLSLQVHPPAEIATRLGGEPKTENWYVAHADAGAAVFAGLASDVSAEDFENALTDGTAEKCMHRLAVHAGDSVLIRSGVMHAIDAGNVILEIQQNSDTTYRVYDWGRVGLDGKPRELHIRESLECLRVGESRPAPTLIGSGGDAVLAECDEFRIRRISLDPRRTLVLGACEEPRIISVVSGVLRCDAAAGGELKMGDNALLPFAAEGVFSASDQTVVLVTDRFNSPR